MLLRKPEERKTHLEYLLKKIHVEVDLHISNPCFSRLNYSWHINEYLMYEIYPILEKNQLTQKKCNSIAKGGYSKWEIYFANNIVIIMYVVSDGY